MVTAEATDARTRLDEERYEAYNRWKGEQFSDPRIAGVRMLMDDIRDHDRIQSDTWERFDVEERTWGAEVLNAPHSHVDTFQFDGKDVIVKESDGINPRITLRDVYQGGLDKTLQDAQSEPGLAYQVIRDQAYMEFYEQVERMMRGEIETDTIHMISTCPLPSELSSDPEEAKRLMDLRWYDNVRRKSFDYTARRLPNGQLEMSATTLDSSNMQAHAAVLKAYGYENVSFEMLQSHQYGRYLSYENTAHIPIETVIAGRVGVYDESLTEQTGQSHKHGRVDDTIDAHEFFNEHCDAYWTGYKVYHELLARHLAGDALEKPLQKYLLKCLEAQEKVERSVLSGENFQRLRKQLWHGTITSDMAMSCRELLVYSHHATLKKLLKQYSETGEVDQLEFANGEDLMDSYADAGSSNGAESAANGDTFAGCETATSVSELTSFGSAVVAAKQAGVSVDQMLRMQNDEARHCLNIQIYGFTIRRKVHCPFCDKEVDAKDTQSFIECLSAECGTILDKDTGKTRIRERFIGGKSEDDEAGATRVRLRNGVEYTLGEQTYVRRTVAVVGGVRVTYIAADGTQIIGMAAEQLEAAIVAVQREVEIQAS